MPRSLVESNPRARGFPTALKGYGPGVGGVTTWTVHQSNIGPQPKTNIHLHSTVEPDTIY